MNIKQRINEHCCSLGMEPDGKGYVKNNEDNLIEVFASWPEIKSEFSKGQGSELIPDKVNGRAKFCAVHSSSALCVNNFAPFKTLPNQFILFGFCNISKANFEKKIQTGISTPNLDYYFETDNEMVGVESKYLEILDSKLPNWAKADGKGNLEKYIDRKQLQYLPAGFQSLIENYIDCKAQMYLDVAQLLKHAIGLLNPNGNTARLQPVLAYIYWQPTNWRDLPEYVQHEAEIEGFRKRLEPYLRFMPKSYLEFWEDCSLDATLSEYFTKIKRRYSLVL